MPILPCIQSPFSPPPFVAIVSALTPCSLAQKVLAVYPKGGDEVKAECLDFFMDTFGNRPELRPVFEESRVLELVGRQVNLREAGEVGEEVELNWKAFGEYVDGGWL